RRLLGLCLTGALERAPRPPTPRPFHIPWFRGHPPRVPGLGHRGRPHRRRLRVGGRGGLPDDDHRLARDEPALLALLAAPRLPPLIPAPLPVDSLTTLQRVPLLSGTKLAIVNAGDDDVVLRPPPPGEPIDDVGAAVRDALRFPLSP